MVLAGIGAGLAVVVQVLVLEKLVVLPVLDAIARQPEAAGRIETAMIIGLLKVLLFSL